MNLLLAIEIIYDLDYQGFHYLDLVSGQLNLEQ